MFNFFNKKDIKKEKVISFPIHKKNIFKKLSEIIENPDLISNVCELNYEGINLSEEEKKVISNIEDRCGQKIIAPLLCKFNKPKDKYFGWRFSHNKETFDLFSNHDGMWFLGQSKKANHLVFNLKNEYQGETLNSGFRYEYEVLCSILESILFSKLLGEPFSCKYKIDLDKGTITEISA